MEQFFIEIHEASGSRHGHGQWGAVLFLTLWPQGLGPDLTASNIRVGYRHVARDREIGTFWIAIFCKNNLWVQRMALKSHFRARGDASQLAQTPKNDRGGVPINGALQHAAESWWSWVAHVRGDGGLGALELETPGCPLGPILAHSATLQDSCWDRRSAQGLAAVGEERGASTRRMGTC